jgi:hypothetical protein
MRLAAVVSVVGLSGCNQDKVENAVGDAMIAIGGLAILVKHPYAMIAGVVLVAGGAALKVYVATKDGNKIEEELPLTDQQRREIQDALARGEKFRVRQPDGSNEKTLEPK